MAKNRSKPKIVLLVLDVQVGVMKNCWDASRIIKNISTVVDKARELGVPVMWVQHSDDELIFGSPDWEQVPELSPIDGEIMIHKHFNSAFEETSLGEMLGEIGASHIVLAGASTNWCIRATAFGALERGYHLTLVADGHTTETLELEDDFTIKAADIVRELNTAMTWLSYPDRRNTALPVDEIDFVPFGGIP